MTKRLTVMSVIATSMLLGICLKALFAGEDSPSAWASLEKSYAQANLQLAQARLAQARHENQTVAGSVSDGTLAELSAGVQLTQLRLRQLESGATGDLYAPQIAAAEDAIRGREADYAESVKANSIQAGAVPDVELRREYAEIAVAKARLASLKALAQQPPEVRMQWEISQLQDQIRALWARPLIQD
jgi:hypothetical protein